MAHLYGFLTAEEHTYMCESVAIENEKIHLDNQYTILMMEHEARLHDIETALLLEKYTVDDLETLYRQENVIFEEAKEGWWAGFKKWIKGIIHAILGIKDEIPKDAIDAAKQSDETVSFDVDVKEAKGLISSAKDAIKKAFTFKGDDGKIQWGKISLFGIGAIGSGAGIAVGIDKLKKKTEVKKSELPEILDSVSKDVQEIEDEVNNSDKKDDEEKSFIRTIANSILTFARDIINKIKNILGKAVDAVKSVGKKLFKFGKKEVDISKIFKLTKAGEEKLAKGESINDTDVIIDQETVDKCKSELYTLANENGIKFDSNQTKINYHNMTPEMMRTCLNGLKSKKLIDDIPASIIEKCIKCAEQNKTNSGTETKGKPSEKTNNNKNNGKKKGSGLTFNNKDVLKMTTLTDVGKDKQSKGRDVSFEDIVINDNIKNLCKQHLLHVAKQLNLSGARDAKTITYDNMKTYVKEIKKLKADGKAKNISSEELALCTRVLSWMNSNHITEFTIDEIDDNAIFERAVAYDLNMNEIDIFESTTYSNFNLDDEDDYLEFATTDILSELYELADML